MTCTKTQNLAITKIATPRADAFLVRDTNQTFLYSYGGTRMVSPNLSDPEVIAKLTELGSLESGLKNALINRALASGVVDAFAQDLPEGYQTSRVSGGRCIIRPHDTETASILQDVTHPDFAQTIREVFACIGEELNALGGALKLTPDFGRFAGLSDILAEFTPHVLGIRREAGGSGGKSSFSATGVVAALEVLGGLQEHTRPVTLVGSAGAMGVSVLDTLLKHNLSDLAVCDLAYDLGAASVPDGVQHLQARWGRFTNPCLQRGGFFVATTVGKELENSEWPAIPAGTTLVLAHNHAIPAGPQGLHLTDSLCAQGVRAIPGQVLTLGGALTTRLEWFHRQANPGQLFNKPLAHAIVRAVVGYLVVTTLARAEEHGISPYRAMLEYAGFSA